MQEERFSNRKYHNWIKVGLSLNYLKEGIEDFVDDQCSTLHRSMTLNIQQASQTALQGAACSKCHHAHIQHPYDKSSRSRKWVLPCPNNICNLWLEQITHFHCRQPHPAIEWANIDPQQWPTKPWDVIKCYQPYGCKGHTRARDSDCSALLTIFTDCKFFQKHVSNVQSLREVKDIRNKTMHSATQEIEDSDMLTYINKIISLLEDPTQLQGLTACKDAVQKIKQLRDNPLTLLLMKQSEQPLFLQLSSTLATEVERIKHEMTQHKETQHELIGKIEHLETIKGRMECMLYDTIDNKRRISHMQHVLENLRSSAESRILKDDTSINQLEEYALSHSLKTTMSKQTSVQQNKGYPDVPAKHSPRSDLNTQLQQDILSHRNFLIDLYELEYSEVPIYPLVQDETLLLDDLYVPPLIKIDSVLTGIKLNGSKIEASYSYEDILSSSTKRRSSLNRKIYLVGEGGTGKTTFCLQMVRTWCKAHLQNDTGKKCSKDEEYLRTFDLLFYIQLRSFCMFGKVEEMIDLLMDRHMSDSLRYANSLIILDGLDEWDPPPDNKPAPLIKYGLPARSKSNKYTILTTTRNWKLEVVRPLKKEITRLVDLHGVETEAAVTIAKTLIDVLNSKSEHNQRHIEDFVQEVKRNRLESFMSTPVLLTQLVCLWHDGKPFGNSQCTVYANMLDRQFELAQLKQKIKPPIDARHYELPNCFNKSKTCQKYKKVIREISSLASFMLLNNRQSVMVLSQSDVDQWSIEYSSIIDIGLKIGLLSQSKVFTKSSERSKSLTFVHQTFQEFLAAVFVCETGEVNIHNQRVSKMFPSVDMFLEMSTVLLFFCSMSPNIGTRLLQGALQSASDDSRIMEYRQKCDKIDQNYETATSIQDITLEIAKEIAHNEDQCVILPVLDLVINRMVLESELCLYELKPEVIKSIFIDTKALLKKQAKFLLETMKRLKHLGSLEMLHIYDKLKSIDVNNIFQMVFSSKTNLCCIRFEGVDISELLPLNFETLFMVLKLSHLALVDVKLTDEQHELLFKCLAKTAHLKTLYIVNTKVIPLIEMQKRQTLNILKHDTLETLLLENLNTDNICLNPASLKSCSMNLSSPHSVESVVHTLRMGVDIEEISIRPCRNQDVIIALSQTVPCLTNLRSLRLYRLDLSKVALELSPKMNHLEEVSLSFAAFSSSTLESLVESFPRHRFTLQLECVTVKYEDDYLAVNRYLDSNTNTVFKMREVSLVMKMGNSFQFYNTNIVLDLDDVA